MVLPKFLEKKEFNVQGGPRKTLQFGTINHVFHHSLTRLSENYSF